MIVSRLIGFVAAFAVAGADVPALAAEFTARELTEQLYRATGPVDLSGRDLEGLDLSLIDFKKTRLQNARMFGVNLSGSNLAGADLAAANLDRANIIGANFDGANLAGASWRSLPPATGSRRLRSAMNSTSKNRRCRATSRGCSRWGLSSWTRLLAVVAAVCT